MQVKINSSKFEKKEKIYSETDFDFYEILNKEINIPYLARTSVKSIYDFFKNEIINLQNEIEIISLLKHPSINKFVSYSFKFFDKKQHPTIITEFCSNGTLSQILSKNEIILDNTKKLIIIYGIASGMSYLHSHNILHCDLKTDRILLDDRLFPKISGFNISCECSSETLEEKSRISGTPAFLAPEIYLKNERSKASDVYAFSYIVYILMTNETPFLSYKNANEIEKYVCNNGERPAINELVPEAYRKLIENCWSQNPKKRPTFNEIVRQLRSNPKFITNDMNKDEFKNYIKFIDESEISFGSSENMPKIDINQYYELRKVYKNKIPFKGIYETETVNLFYFLKRLDFNKIYKRKDLLFMTDDFKKYQVVDKKTKKNYSAKIFKKTYKIESFFQEINANLLFINNPCFCKFVGFDLDCWKIGHVIVSEMNSNGSLSKILDAQRYEKTKNNFDDTKKLINIYGIAYGMSCMHSNNIVHGNLKTDYIELNEFLLPKICYHYHVDYLNDDICFKTEYMNMAPEFFLEMKYTKEIDVYSFAFIVYELLTYEKPFSSAAILDSKKEIPDYYRDLIESCCSENPKNRPTFDQIVEVLESYPCFITENINEKLYRKYINYVKNPELYPYDSDDIIEIEIESKHLSIDIDSINLDQFEKQKKIGTGSFGKVYEVLNIKTGELLACKISKYPLEFCSYNQIKNMEREIKILSKLDYPSILKFIGYNENNKKGEPRPTFITELVPNGSLDTILELVRKGLAGDNWSDTKKLIIIFGVASGMAYLHSLDILHRDLKPGNIFIDEYLFPKIGDFGLSKEVTDENDNQLNSGHLGTAPYMSPEIIKEFEYTKKGDVYAFSMIVYEIVTNEVLFKDCQLCQQIMMKVAYGFRPVIRSDIPKCYRELIQNCWNENLYERPSFDEIVDNLKNNPEFITDTVVGEEFFKYVDYVESYLSLDKTENNENLRNDLFQKVSINLKLAEDTIDESDPLIKNGFLNLKHFEKVKLQSTNDTFKIYEVKHKETGAIYSAKVTTIKMKKLSKREIMNFSREVNNISQIKHPSILKFIGYSRKDFRNKNKPVIITEITPNGTLRGILLNKEKGNTIISKWNDTKKLINIYGIASGMYFLHSNNIIHRNLTPEEIFLDDDLYPKIGHFGLSVHIHTQESLTFQSTLGVKGNPVFSAPEVLQFNDYSKSSDVYSFGLIVYEIMTNKIPFENVDNINNIIIEITNNSLRPKLNDDIDECFRQLIECCWSQDPIKRPTFEDIINILKTDSRFITNEVDENEYKKYIKYIESADIEFYSRKKSFKITDKNSENENEETNNNKLNNDQSIAKNQDNKIVESEKLNNNQNSDSNIENENENKIKEIEIEQDNQYISLSHENMDQITINESNKESESVLHSIEEFIQKCISSNQLKNLIEYLANNFDNETISDVFDRFYNESPNIYENLCKEGILLNNAVARHKYALLLILKGNESQNENEKFSYYKEARNHLEKSLKQGFNKSYFSLSLLLHQIYNKNHSAIKYAIEGEKKGDKYSKCLLGHFISKGIGIKKDRNKGVQMMLESQAEDYFEQFATDIGLYFIEMYEADNQQRFNSNCENRIENEKLSKKAFQWFEKAFNMNKTKATINNYGICYMIGFGVSKNIEKAIEIFNIGLSKGDSNCKYHLSFIFEKLNPELSNKYLKESAYEGNILAQRKYAIKMYEIDREESLKFFKLTANQGQIESQKSIKFIDEIQSYEQKCKESDIILAKEYSIENDTENTFKYMSKCIFKGQSNIVLKYAVSLYNSKHYKESYIYFQMMCNINHPIAKYYIGVQKYFGQGCKKNIDESKQIMEILSEKGIEKASEFIETYF